MDKFLVEVSARHIHLNREDMDILFGAGSELHPMKELSQPGQYASEEKVTLVGPKGKSSVRVLGIRESGDLEGTTGDLTLVGPAGEKAITCGVIAAKRHVHMTPADAERFGVENGEIVNVKIDTDGRSVVFGDTVIRVSEKYALAMHIDTDEANAAAISGTAEGTIIKL